MESKVQKAKKNTDIAEENDGVKAEKIKFPLYVFPETMKTVDILYKSDNCSSRTEFYHCIIINVMHGRKHM